MKKSEKLEEPPESMAAMESHDLAAALDDQVDAEPLCPGCGEPWPGPGFCGSCARTPGDHP